MALDKKKRDDALAVLAALSAAVPDSDPDGAEDLLDENGTIHVADNSAVVGSKNSPTLCGHSLEIIDGAKLLIGGGGVVIPCREARDRSSATAAEHLPDVRYAVKVARPSLFLDEPAMQREEAEKARLEYDVHLPLAHENIAKMYSFEEILISVRGAAVAKLELPCTLIEWVDNALPLDEYVRCRLPRSEDFADLISQACRALAHLHSTGMVHWDLKGDNLLVSGAGQVKLMDLGNARRLRQDGETYEVTEEAESTYGHLPPQLHERTPEPRLPGGANGDSAASRNRVPCELKSGERVWDRPWLDLYMLARECNRIACFDSLALASDPVVADHSDRALDTAAQIFVGEQGEFVQSYLQRLFGRLLEANSPSMTPFYAGAGQVVEALERLRPEYGAGTDIPELQAVPQHVLRIPPAENIPWTARIDALMDSNVLLRLKKHHQLATVRHVYPGAEHTRWEHTIGVLGRALQSIRALYADRQSILFRLNTSKLDLTALMLATLLHDVGHPAFGHQLEESPLITPERRHEAYAVELLRAAQHEDGGGKKDAAEVRSILIAHWCIPGVDVDALLIRVIEVLEGVPQVSVRHEDARVHLELLHSLLVGPLDADKSDYLARDAHHCGVEYATGVDRKRLDQTLTAIEVTDDSQHPPRTTAVLGINRKGVLPLESMLVARYQLFRAVYWHHTVRAITVMLQELVEGYVLPHATPGASGQAERLQKLQHHFRELADEEAINWLLNEIDQLDAPVAEKIGLKELGMGVLGHRPAFPSCALELFGTDKSDVELYIELRDKWSRDPDDADGLRTVQARRVIRQKFAENLMNLLPTENTELGVSDLLLDVPVKGKDEVTGLFVAGVHGGQPQSVDAVTPLAKSVAHAFELAVRPVRVFLRPSAAHLIGTGTAAEAASGKMLREALERTVLGQMQIPDAVASQPH